MSSAKSDEEASDNNYLVDEVDLLFVRVYPSEYEAMELDTTMLSRVMEADLMASRLDHENGKQEVTENAWPSLKERIQRFLRRRDRYIALVSLLLKSQAYYQDLRAAASNPDTDTADLAMSASVVDKHQRPIVDLPRTSHTKPFIPRQKQLTAFSISHQAPFIGMARWLHKAGSSSSATPQDTNGSTASAASEQPSVGSCELLSIGFDIVVFEKLNTKLYRTIEDFLDVFRSSFASAEWLQLLDAPDRLCEFYIRWSMKEAYTKALGLGMSYSFDQFQITLQNCTSTTTAPADEDTSIWSWIGTKRLSGSHAVSHGTVQRQNPKLKEDNMGRLIGETERWLFIFRPLPLTTESSTVSGCACACVGPLDEEDYWECGQVQIRDNWTTVHELLQFHGIEIGTDPAG